jgi:protein SMG6
MEWVGRRVFECGYWKGKEERVAELEVLETGEGGDEEGSDGRIEDDEGDLDQCAGVGKRSVALTKSELVRWWIRIARCAVNIADVVDGFRWIEGTREWKVEGKLEEKVKRWKEGEREERDEEDKRRMQRRWVGNAMDVDLEEEEEEETEENEEADGEV